MNQSDLVRSLPRCATVFYLTPVSWRCPSGNFGDEESNYFKGWGGNVTQQ